jgi:hypothetical protein
LRRKGRIFQESCGSPVSGGKETSRRDERDSMLPAAKASD